VGVGAGFHQYAFAVDEAARTVKRTVVNFILCGWKIGTGVCGVDGVSSGEDEV
jgi:hypothetical protein